MIDIIFNHFGLFKGYFITVLFVCLRYAIFAGPAFLLFYIIKNKSWQALKIQQKAPQSKFILGEIQHSLYSAFVFALIGVGIHFCRKAGYTQIYLDIQEYGWLYFCFSILAFIFIHDTYFYWIHRLMHQKKWFRQIHKVHHQSFNPTPWAALSFHPMEAILEIGIIPVMVFLIPIHPLALFLFVTWSLLWNVIGHLGYEIFPAGFVHHPIFKWFNTSTHHNMHHEKANCNYGLYFNIWDTLMQTNHKAYKTRFEELTALKKNAS
jgi:lathosterol oxidase